MTELIQKFNEEFSKHARELEGEKHEIYIDSKGIPTISVGYALIHRIGDKWEPNLSGLKESGVNPSKSLVNDLRQYAPYQVASPLSNARPGSNSWGYGTNWQQSGFSSSSDTRSNFQNNQSATIGATALIGSKDLAAVRGLNLTANHGASWMD